jgi:hypothetical protein
MKKALLVLLAFPFIAMQCHEKEGPECHYNIKIQNTSGKDIVVAHNTVDAEGRYSATYVTNVTPNKVEEYQSYDCWEYHTGSNSREEIYLLEAGSLKQDTLIMVDTLVKHNKLLKRISLNNDELKNSYFVITYP